MLIAIIMSVVVLNVSHMYLLSAVSYIVMLSVIMLIAIIMSVVVPNISHML